MAKKVRDKKPVLEFLVGIGARYWKFMLRWRVGWRIKVGQYWLSRYMLKKILWS